MNQNKYGVKNNGYNNNDNKPTKIEPLLFDDSRGLAQLIKDKVKEYAEKIFKNRAGRDNYTQIRKYYDELIKLQQKSASCNDDDFEKYLTSIYMVAAKSSYAVARKTLSNSLNDFIDRNVKKINTKDDLDKFIMLFEAFLGYFKFYEKNKE